MGLKSKFKDIKNMGVNYAKAQANIATLGQVNAFGGTGKLGSSVADSYTLGIYNTYQNKEADKAAKSADEAMKYQQEEQAQAEKDKYQAMVDANFSDVAKKRSKMTGRPGSGLYAGLSGGSGGLYNV